MTQEFFKADTPHGFVKRIMYKKYLQAFIPITQQAKTEWPLKTVIIDGFAGAGCYGEEWPDTIESYGSPLIALMVSLNYFYRKQHRKDKTWGKQPTEGDTDAEIVDLVATMALSDDISSAQIEPSIHLYFIEASEVNCSSLKENIAEVLDAFFPNPDESYEENKEYYPTENGENLELIRFSIKHPYYPIVCNLVKAKFVEFEPPLEVQDDYAKCLVFLDPFGYSQIPMSHVKKFSGPGNSLLINFMSSFVNRFHSANEDAIRRLFGIDYMYDVLANGNHFQESLPLDKYCSYLLNRSRFAEQPLNNIQSCAATYEKCLRRFFETDLSLTFEMRRSNNCIVYHLIFVTGHIKSLEIMKESMNRCSQVENGFSMSDYKFYRNGCQLNLANTQDVSLVADAIYDKFEGCSRVMISQIKDYVMLDTPYLFRKKPLAVMVKEKNRRITQVVDTSGIPPSIKGTFPDHIDWVLQFEPKEETINLADKLLKHYHTNYVPLSAIKDTLSQPEYVRLYYFIQNALFLLASKGNIDVYYADEEDSIPKLKDIFNSAMEWYIVFRPIPQTMAQLPVFGTARQPTFTLQPVQSDNMVFEGINYKRVDFC